MQGFRFNIKNPFLAIACFSPRLLNNECHWIAFVYQAEFPIR